MSKSHQASNAGYDHESHAWISDEFDNSPQKEEGSDPSEKCDNRSD